MKKILASGQAIEKVSLKDWGSRHVLKIEPYVGLGPIKLGMTSEEVRQVLFSGNEPIFNESKVVGFNRRYIFSSDFYGETYNVEIEYDTDGKCQEIMTSSSRYMESWNPKKRKYEGGVIPHSIELEGKNLIKMQPKAALNFVRKVDPEAKYEDQGHIKSVFSKKFGLYVYSSPHPNGEKLDIHLTKYEDWPEKPKPTVEENKADTEKYEQAEARKQRSIARLRDMNIPVLEALPVITGGELTSKEAAVDRMLALFALAMISESVVTNPDGSREEAENMIQRIRDKFEIEDTQFSEKERNYIENPWECDDSTKHKFLWSYECVDAFLWVLGRNKSDHLSLEGICDAGSLAHFLLTQNNKQDFMESCTVRSKADILEELDTLYRCHWAVNDARISGNPVPEGLDPGVVAEKRRVLEWMVGECSWANVNLST